MILYRIASFVILCSSEGLDYVKLVCFIWPTKVLSGSHQIFILGNYNLKKNVKNAKLLSAHPTIQDLAEGALDHSSLTKLL